MALCHSFSPKVPPQPTSGAWPYPNTTSQPESWVFNLSQSHHTIEQLDNSQLLQGKREGNCYYFDWTEVEMRNAFEADQEEIGIELSISMRTAEAAKHLKEPRRALARYEKMLKGIENSPANGELKFQLERDEKQLIATNWWLRHQLATKTSPWSPEGLASTVQIYIRSCSGCWENVRLDGEGNTQLSGQRSLIWKDQMRFVKVLREALVP